LRSLAQGAVKRVAKNVVAPIRQPTPFDQKKDLLVLRIANTPTKEYVMEHWNEDREFGRQVILFT